MSLSRIHRRFTAWLAMLALVMSALAPTVSQAVVLASDRPEGFEVCTSTGVMWVSAESPSDSQPAMPEHGSSCDLCTHSLTGAPPVPMVLAAPALGAPVNLTPALTRPALAAAPWAPAQSRAPPAFA